MTSLYARGSTIWCRVKLDDGSWASETTRLLVGDEAEAKSLADARQSLVDLPLPGIVCDRQVSSREGWVYVIQLEPKRLPNRIKIGFTTDVSQRLRTFQTTSPRLTLVGLWHADAREEQVALRMIRGRIGSSEVFDCPSVRMALVALDVMLCSAKGVGR